MIEKIDDGAQVYQYAFRSQGEGKPGRWDLIKKIENYPNELDIGLPILPFYSPDFHVRLGVNFENKEFHILDSETNEIKIKIPKDFMTFEDNPSLQNVMRRFIFIDDQTIKLIN